MAPVRRSFPEGVTAALPGPASIVTSASIEGTTMEDPLILVNTYKVKQGHLDDYLTGCKVVLDVVSEKHPRMHHIGFYVSDDGTEATAVQIHPDSESLLHHMQLVADHVEGAREYLDWGSMEIHLYGSPNQAVLKQMREIAGSGVPVTIQEASAALTRLPER